MRAWLVATVALAGALSLSCQVDQYCLNCDKGDAGPGDGGSGGSGDAMDASLDAGDGGLCVPSIEICDGKDNDCDGKIDEEPSDDGIGSACPNVKGDCAGGVLACISGKVKCNKLGSPEICDNRDNDCDGVIDNGDPGDGVTQGGSKCGTDVGECVAGVNHCVNGAIQCIGRVDGSAESCNAKDDDCDGKFDEGLTNLGTCGSSSTGACTLGTLVCESGGVIRCEGAVEPGLEICNNIDDDCDGKTDEGFDIATDPENCGACGNVCHLNHAFAGCGGTPPTCTVAACQAGFHDNNKDPSDGCEFGPCTITGAEVCNGKDDDCSGGSDDNLPPPPAICANVGACIGTIAQCDGSNGYNCHYPGDVSTDGNFNIVPETQCDGIDNDCDGKIDEGQPNLGQACHDSGIGACQGTGHFGCDAANPTGPAICIIDKPGQGSAQPEQCDNIDNDCDGKIDEGAGSGSLIGQSWIDIGNHKQMMEFEASRPDAGSDSVGQINTTVCSKANVMPWNNIDYPDALAACQSVGASLCTEQDWHRTCSVIAPTTYPIVLPSTGTVTAMVEAEDYFANTPAIDVNGISHAWVEDYNTDNSGRTFSGISDMQAIPAASGANTVNSDALTHSPHLDFQFTMGKATSTYNVWVLLESPNSNATRVAVNFDGGAITTNNERAVPTANNQWQWIEVAQTFTLAKGTHTLNVYEMRPGVRIDAIEVTDGSSAPSLPQNPAGNTWSYLTNPNTEQTGVCNDHNFDSTQDATIPTGTDASCQTTTGVFDMSGNVKEWVLAHQSGQNPIRGGAADNSDNGTTCALNFTLADNAFFFPNVGFRCCRVGP